MAGTIVETHSKRGPIGLITLTCTADAADGSYPAQALATKFSGELLRMVTNPGATAPTNLYDVVLNDGDSVDVLYGAGANLLTATTEDNPIQVIADVTAKGHLMHPPISVEDVLTWTITNNSVNSAIIVAKLYYRGHSESGV